MEKLSEISVGSYLAQRMVDAGANRFFTVPGDFTLSLLDDLLANPNLKMVGCCNELSAGYAADGYCRATGGIGVVVGGLCAINAIAGAYSDDLPVLIVSGGPNSHDKAKHRLVHHTIGEHDFYQASRCFEPVVAKVLNIRDVCEAQEKIDEALFSCGSLRKPVYLEIACDLSAMNISLPTPVSPNFYEPKMVQMIDTVSCEAATNDILHSIKECTKIVLVAGKKIGTALATDPFTSLAQSLGCGVAVMSDAKGIFPENHPQYMGCYWAGVSSRHVQEIVESADLIVCVGTVWNDYTTVGWSALLPKNKVITIQPTFVNIFGKQRYPQVAMGQLLLQLSRSIDELQLQNKKQESLIGFRRYSPYHKHQQHDANIAMEITVAKAESEEAPLCLRYLLEQLQRTIYTEPPSSSSNGGGDINGIAAIVAETGDSWFIGQSLRLPDGVQYHVQMQYGSCGWALPACLGIGVAIQKDNNNTNSDVLCGDTGDSSSTVASGSSDLPQQKQQSISNSSSKDTDKEISSTSMVGNRSLRHRRRILALIGDGSFQMTAPELSTLIRQNIDLTIILLNNGTYTIEVQIYDGAYNNIVNWKYAEYVDIVCGRDHSTTATTSIAKGIKATTNHELLAALKQAEQHKGVMLIGCSVDKDDCTSSLLEWGSRVAAANMK